ncbi:MAG: PQQ-binding-like beta-propeller repeat protein [Bacteroidota bacterium]
MNNLKPPDKTIRLLHSIAFAGAMLAFVLCILISVNYFQVKSSDPLNSPVMKSLIEKFKSNPGDEQLKAEIRELDLLARKAFFTNQWQIRTGGYLLLFSVLVVIICLKTAELMTAKISVVLDAATDNFWDLRKINRKWVAYSGIFLVCVSLLFAFLTHNELGKTLDLSAKSNGSTSDSIQPNTDNQTAKTDSASISHSASLTGQDSTSLTQSMDGFPTQQEINANSPSFRGPGSVGTIYQRGFPTSWNGGSGKNIKWKTTVPLPGYNSPIVWNDKIFLSGASATKREVYCFDLNSGKILWQTAVDKIPGSSVTAPKVNGETGFAAPTLTTDGRRVYAIFANGDLIALDFEGKKVWAKSLGLPKNHYGHSSSLAMFHDLLIVQFDQSGNTNVIAFAGKTGEQVWKTSRDVKISWSSPIVVNTGKQTEAMLVAEPFVISYNPATGKELWRFNCISGEVGPSLAYADGMVFSVNDYSKLAAVQIGASPKLLWESDEYLSDIPSPVATAKYVFLPTSYGMMLCYDAKTGEKYWEKDFGTPTYASAMLVDGNIWQMDKKGIMHIFKADKTYTSVSESPLGEGSVCTPAFIGGKIIIRGDKNLYCIGK